MDIVRNGESRVLGSELSTNLLPWTATLGTCAAIFSILVPITTAWKDKAYLELAVLVIFAVSIAIVAYQLKPKPRPSPPPRRKYFQGVRKITKDQAWHRFAECEKLCNTIIDPEGRPIIVVGSSGVGKSVLLETQVVPKLEENHWIAVSCSNYDGLRTFLLDAFAKVYKKISPDRFLRNATLDGIDGDIKLLLIFDQFEQFLGWKHEHKLIPRVDEEHEKEKEWFRSFLENASRQTNIRNVIVVRKEWYYDLRFLREYVPAPIQAFDLGGLKMDRATDPTDYEMLKAKIETATQNPEVADIVLGSLTYDNEIRPVEAQMVGLMLENIALTGEIIDEEYYLRRLGGKDALIDAYLHAYLRSSPDRDVCLKVLFALSAETVFRTRISRPEIADIIHESRGEVGACLDFLVEEGLALKTETAKYELAHDYLAERLHRLSGSELDPVERDNITYFWDEMSRGEGARHITKRERLKDREKKRSEIALEEKHSKLQFVFSDIFMGFLSLLLLLRLLGPALGLNWGWFNRLGRFQEAQAFIDVYYLPVFASHLGWSLYVTLFYRRFLSYLAGDRLGSMFSKLTVVICTLCVSLAVFFPYYWLISIGIGGVAMGLKSIQLSRTRGLSQIPIKHFWSMGAKAALNSAFVILFGGIAAYYVHTSPWTTDAVNTLNNLFLLFAILMVYYVMFVRPNHITKEATSKMMGLYDRRQ